MASTPKEAQRIIVTGELNRETSDFVERHVRRALSIPARAADAQQSGPPPLPTGTVAYAVSSEGDKVDVAGQMIATAAAPLTLVCRSERHARRLAETLRNRGFAVADDAAANTENGAVRIVVGAGDNVSGADVLSYDVPFDAEALSARHGTGGTVLATPRELPHLRRIAAEANLALRPLGGTEAVRSTSELALFRDRIRTAAREEDLEAQVLVLAPLLDEMSAVEVAASLSALLRKQLSAAAAPSAPNAQQRGAPRSYVRLYVGLGEKDNIRPGDIVGAIAGEAGLSGDQVGKIEIRDSFSVVEVPSDAAERIIKSLNGTTVKGRSVRVDYDRQGTPGAKPPRSAGPGGPSGGRGGGPGRGTGGSRPPRPTDRGARRPS
jgi:ATP-dependent RNA helicase DeaD